VVTSGLRLLVLAVLGLLLWGGWYLANKGFGRQWRTTVVEELRKRGIEASVRRLTLDPFRGLIAQDLRIYDPKNRDTPLASISEVALDINYAALLHRQPFLNAIDVRNANLTFPSPRPEPQSTRAQLQQFHAHIYFPPEQIYISQAEGIFCGVRISATGQLLNRLNRKPTRTVTDEEWRQRMEWLQRLAEELGNFTFAGGPPSVQVKCSGDLAEMEQARIEVTLSGERIQRGGYEFKAFSAAGEWVERKIDLKQLEWTDSEGSFSGRASWSAVTKEGDFQVQSSANAKQLLDSFGFGKYLADTTFASRPVIELSGSGNSSGVTPRLSVIGRVQVENFTFKNIPLLNLAAGFAWDGRRTMFRDLRLRDASGELLADYLEGTDAEQATAGAVYAGTLAVTAIFFTLLWLYAAGNHRLVSRNLDPNLLRTMTRRYVLGTVAYLIAFALAFVSVSASLALIVVLALIFVLPEPGERARKVRPGRTRRRGAR